MGALVADAVVIGSGPNGLVAANALADAGWDVVKMPMVSYDGGMYSVPCELLGQTVWVRVHGAGAGEQVVIVHIGAAGSHEVARHVRAEPGSPKMSDAHFPPAPAGALRRIPKARNGSEAAFLQLGDVSMGRAVGGRKHYY